MSSHSDDLMMDAPDSPPEMPSASIGNLITTLSSGSSKDTSPMTMAPPASKASGETKVSFGAPGSSWNTKKFSEEYERAEATLLDKNWNANQYGDPLMPNQNREHIMASE